MKSNKIIRNLSLATLIGLSSSLFAQSSNLNPTEEFVGNVLKTNKTVKKVLSVEQVGSLSIDKKWRKNVVKISILTTQGEKQEHFIPILTNGKFFTEVMYDKNAKPVDISIMEKVDELYTPEHLIYAPKNLADVKDRVVVFSDFECPFCNRNAPSEISKLIKKGDTEIYYYDYPLEVIHPNSRDIALVVITARSKYPNKKLEIISTLYKKKSFQWTPNELSIGLKNVIKKYNSIFPDMPISINDIEKYHAEKRLHDDQIIAVEVGVNSTPTMFKNGELVVNSKKGEQRHDK